MQESMFRNMSLKPSLGSDVHMRTSARLPSCGVMTESRNTACLSRPGLLMCVITGVSTKLGEFLFPSDDALGNGRRRVDVLGSGICR